MNPLVSLVEYHRWANGRLLAVCRETATEKLEQAIDGTVESVLKTAWHMLAVQQAFIEMMTSALTAVPAEVPIDALAVRSEELDGRLEALVAGLTEGEAARMFLVPWFGKELTVQDGLLQLLTHSIEHRADMASALNRLGLKTPELDYIFRIAGDYQEEAAARG